MLLKAKKLRRGKVQYWHAHVQPVRTQQKIRLADNPESLSPEQFGKACMFRFLSTQEVDQLRPSSNLRKHYKTGNLIKALEFDQVFLPDLQTVLSQFETI